MMRKIKQLNGKKLKRFNNQIKEIINKKMMILKIYKFKITIIVQILKIMMMMNISKMINKMNFRLTKISQKIQQFQIVEQKHPYQLGKNMRFKIYNQIKILK